MTGVSAIHRSCHVTTASPDRDRFDLLYAENLPLILGYVLRRSGGDTGDAADVAAEVFLTLWRRLATVPAGQ